MTGASYWFKNNSGSSPGIQDTLSGGALTDRYGNVRQFNATGDMIARIDSAGNTTSYAYNSDGTLAEITDPRGQVTAYTYGVNASTGNHTVTIETINSLSNSALNQQVYMEYLPYTGSTPGELSIIYDDPDDAGPRKSREEVFIYDVQGRLSGFSVGEDGGSAYTTNFAYNSLDGRVASISYPDGSSLTFDLTRQQNGLISKDYVGGPILATDPRALRVSAPGSGNENAFPNYAISTWRRSSSSDPQRTISQYDHRGRLLRTWDPKQVEALGLTTVGTLGDTEILLLEANVDLSTEFTRTPTDWDDFGNVTGNDWGEITQQLSPDPDKVLISGVLQSNGPAGRQSTSTTYSNNNPVSSLMPECTTASWTWDDTFDVMTSSTDATGNNYLQQVDAAGRVTQMQWKQNASLGQNPTRPLDVNDDSYVTSVDALQIINYLNTNGETRAPVGGGGTSFYDIDGDGWVTSIDAELVLRYYGNPNPYNEVDPEPEIIGQVEVSYVSTAGLPTYLVAQRVIQTGRSSGDTVIDYEYYNTPSDPARHAQLKSVTESDGTAIAAVTEYFYDDRGNLDEISDPAGRVTKFYHDASDRMIAQQSSDPDGAGALLPVLARYDYDVFGNVIASEQINSFVDGSQLLVTSLTQSSTYDSSNRLTAQYTQNPNITWYLYKDGSGNIARTQSKATALAGTTLTAADLETYGQSTVAIPNAPVTSSSYQGLKTTIDYYSTANVVTVSQTDMTAAIPSATTRTTKTTLDRLDQVVKTVSPDPVSGLTTTGSDQREGGGFVTSMEYDNLGNLVGVVDGLSNETTFSYDDLNRLVKTSTPNPASGSPYETTVSYIANAIGWDIETTDPSGISIVEQLDAMGRQRTIAGDTPTSNIRYWDDGSVRTVADAEGNYASYDYDQRGRLTKLTSLDFIGSGRSPITNYSYTVDSLIDTITDPVGRETSFQYDVGGRLIKSTQPDPDGAGALTSAFTQYVRDSIGNVLSIEDALGQVSSYDLDAWYRPTSITDPASGTTDSQYDAFGNVTSVTDPLGNVTNFAFNHLNQLVTAGKVYSGGTENRSYSYDGVGNLRSLTDRNGRVTQYDYDNRYRTETETWKTGATTDRTFDYAYDTSDRLVSIDDSDSLATDFDFAYDDRSQLVAESQLIGLVGTAVNFTREFDKRGNRIELAANLGGTLSGTTISGGVDDFENVYQYDFLNRLTSLIQQSQSGGHAVAPKLAELEYNRASQLTDLHRYSAAAASTSDLQVHTRMDYDDAGRISSLTHGASEIASGENWNGTSTLPASLGSSDLLAAYTFQYDADNRLTQFSTYRDGTSTAYGYDSRDQLTSAASTAIGGLSQPFGLASAESYDFDAGGNRKSSGGASQSAANTHNQLQTDGTYNYTYDDEGNTLSRTMISTGAVTLYEWDHRNRLESITEKTSTVGSVTQKIQYIYDALDQRVGKRLDSDGDGDFDRDEVFLWTEGQTVLRATDSDGEAATETFTLASRYLYGDMVDQLLADEQYHGGAGPELSATTASATAGDTYWALTDHLGSVRDLVDNSGQIRQHIAYDSFGNRIVEQDYDASGSAISSSHADAIDELFGYTGRDWDADAGLQNNRARWYDPATGRWLSNDPIGFAAGDANLYRYVGNEPTTKTDPSGLEPPQGTPTGRPPFELPTEEEMREARRRLGRNRAMGGIAIAAHGNGLPAGAYGPERSSTRSLTPGEVAMLNKFFEGHLNTDGLCVGIGKLHPFAGRNSITPRYTPWFPMSNYAEDFSKADIDLQGHFIHEMTHVLQSQNGNFNVADFFYHLAKNKLQYGLTYYYDQDDLGQPLYMFNFEQQAKITEHYYEGAGFHGRFDEATMERCRQTLKGFHTQLPAFIPDRRYIDGRHDIFDNSGWGYPNFVPKDGPRDSIPYGGF
ncbi:RHS repeat-associated core domain-containing protein [Allorhodopirellula solitaria]|uniref:RHS repeat-associated core domain-containing protein n=1 Tax=Allorhodopirellula solitaria TaxID=2527987 RepID=UPI0011B6995E|nr:RHS repeat-associated core domain-containing protein [Allorhodopirellula solitaria]